MTKRRNKKLGEVWELEELKVRNERRKGSKCIAFMYKMTIPVTHIND